MKKSWLASACLVFTLCLVGCGGREDGVVVDKDEAAKYDVPSDMVEKMESQMTGEAKNK